MLHCPWPRWRGAALAILLLALTGLLTRADG